MEDPLHFLLCHVEVRFGQCPLRPGSAAVARASDGELAEQPLLPDIGELPVQAAQLPRGRRAISSGAASSPHNVANPIKLHRTPLRGLPKVTKV